MGEPARVDSRGGDQTGRQQGSVDGRRGVSEFIAPARGHQGFAAAGHRHRRGWLPGPRPYAASRERPQHYVSGRPEAVPRFVGDRGTPRRGRSIRPGAWPVISLALVADIQVAPGPERPFVGKLDLLNFGLSDVNDYSETRSDI